jgi:hypothetical protein
MALEALERKINSIIKEKENNAIPINIRTESSIAC